MCQRIRRLMVVGQLLLFIALPVTASALDDAILAIVNSEIVTLKDLQVYMKSLSSQLRIEAKTPDEIDEIMAQYERKGIDQLIDDRLILEEANRMGIVIKPGAIDGRLEEIKGKYGSYEEFVEALDSEGLTVSDVRKKIEDQYKGQVAVNQNVRDKIFVNPQEVTEYYNAHSDEFNRKPRVYLDSIFVRSDLGRDEAKAKIDKASAELASGRPFEEVAGRYSELPSVGQIYVDDMLPEIREQVSVLRVGSVSGIVEVPDGFYIFKMQGKAGASEASLKDVKEQIYQVLFEDKFRAEFKAWVEKLREKAYVEIKK